MDDDIVTPTATAKELRTTDEDVRSDSATLMVVGWPEGPGRPL